MIGIQLGQEDDVRIKDKRNSMLSSIISKMNELYLTVEENGKIVYSDLFTKKEETFSGSEEQEFYY